MQAYCRSIGPVAWQTELPEHTLHAGEIHIYRLLMPECLHLLPACLATFDTEEQERASSWLFESYKNSHILGRGMVRILLAKYLHCAPAALKMTEDENGKPALADTPGIHFNVSHSGEIVVVALASRPLGVDVEFIDPHFFYEDLLTTYYSPDEISAIQLSKHPRETFYLLWTRKEALLKATGRGISNEMTKIQCMDSHRLSAADGYKALSFDATPSHIASVATEDDIKKIYFTDMK